MGLSEQNTRMSNTACRRQIGDFPHDKDSVITGRGLCSAQFAWACVTSGLLALVEYARGSDQDKRVAL